MTKPGANSDYRTPTHNKDRTMPLQILPMSARDRAQHHRVSTPLELFFDLVAVIAIAAVTAAFHHAISDGHGLDALPRFVFVFVAIWWAWMNYTWFASAFDNGDAAFTVLTGVSMAGFLIVAGSTEPLFEQLDFSVAVIGWVIMRLALVLLWLRVARDDAAMRVMALRYVVGLGLAQAMWLLIAFGLAPASPLAMAITIIATVFEFSVPLLAERGTKPLPFHRHHLIERYGLLTIIVLGEVLLAASMSITDMLAAGATATLVEFFLATLIIVFAIWWLYFAGEDHLPNGKKTALVAFGYGHLLVYAGVALVGAGLGAWLDVVDHHSKITSNEAIWFVAAPIACALLGIWLVRDQYHALGYRRAALPVAAGLVLLGAALSAPLWAIAAILVLALPLRLGFGRATQLGDSEG